MWSLVVGFFGSAVKNMLAIQVMWEMWVRSLGLEDPWRKWQLTPVFFLAWKIPWTEEPGRLYSPWVVKSWVRLSDWSSDVCSSDLSINQCHSESEVAQSCPTLCDPMNCSPPGSSVHGILQARTMECVAISFFNA